MNSRLLRLPINLKLYKGDLLVKTINSSKKTQIRLRLTDATGWDSGICRVWYNRKKDYWNEFKFTDLETFDRTLTDDTEWDMIKDFAKEGTLDMKFLKKRTQ